MKEKFFSYKTKHYLVKSIELSEEVKLIDLLTQVWTIYKKDSNEVAGTFNFNRPQKKGKVVLSYNFENIQEVDELELIFSYIVKWAFNQKDVYALETAMPENKTYKQIFDFLAYKKFKENVSKKEYDSFITNNEKITNHGFDLKTSFHLYETMIP